MSITKTNLILKCRNELIDIHRHALEAIKPENLIRNNIQVTDGSLIVNSRTKALRYDLSNTRIHVVGGGKSVMAMALGLADIAQRCNIQGLFSHGHLSVPLGLESSICEKTLSTIGVNCSFGSKNNLPDGASVEGSRGILKTISNACDEDRAQNRDSLFIVLISGGGSSCLTSPRYISLSKKLKMIKFLVQKGANIVELNKVRRYYSNIKGGGLARYIVSSNPSSKILSLILSDVIGDPIEFIASGPTHLALSQTAQREQAHQVLSRYRYPIEHYSDEKSNENFDGSLKDNTTRPDAYIVNHIIGSNQIAINAAMHKAHSLGYKVINLGSGLHGDTRDVVARLVGAAKECSDLVGDDRILSIGGGEATVRKADGETWGEGGRAQEMALDYLLCRLSTAKTNEREDQIDMLLSGTTDGQDGPTDVGACLCSYAQLNDSSPQTLRIEDAIEAKTSHDSYNFWRTFRPDWLIKTGLTGTNVMDLYMYSLVRLITPPKNASKL